jgi:riboflavin transporter 2
VITYILFVGFGIGSWVTINGMFTELPLLVNQLPEGWRLASVIAIVVQLANIGPIALCVARRFPATPSSERRLMVFATYAVLLLGAAAMTMLSFSWQTVAHIGGGDCSVSLLIFTFVAALADCTSSVVFWRFASQFRALYISALATGEGMSGVVTSMLAWLQDASG